MKRFFVALSFILFTVIVNGQMLLTLKSGDVLKVNLLSSENGIVVYTLIGDSTKTEKSIPLDEIKSTRDLNQKQETQEPQPDQQNIFITQDTTFERQSQSWIFTNVIYVDSTIKKDKLYQQVKQWFSESFVSSKNVIDNADKDEGVIFGHVTITMKNETYGYVDFNIEVRCKNGKVKYILNNFMQKDAYIVNAFGGIPTGANRPQYSIGSLAQKDLPEKLGYNQTGRSKKGREEMWRIVKNTSKFTAYNLIQSLKANLNKESIKEKDAW